MALAVHGHVNGHVNVDVHVDVDVNVDGFGCGSPAACKSVSYWSQRVEV